MANVLVVGSGGREQALAWKLAQSKQVDEVHVAPGNGGSRGKIKNLKVDFDDAGGLIQAALDKKIDLTVIGQEAASAVGVVDAFKAKGLLIFGPTKAATKVESSKTFSKDLMKAEKIPTAQYKNFTNPKKAIAYAAGRPKPIVVKADGLATGKGVTICQTQEEVEEAINDVMVKKIFGSSGDKVVVEDYLRGQEASLHVLCDGKSSVIFPPSQDHKQIFDGDKGPNTGGMGVVAPVNWMTQQQLTDIKNRIVQPAIRGLKKKGAPFMGCLYPGIMIDGDQINVLEFNARFGDPEAQVYMRLLKGDFYEILKSCAEGKLDPKSVSWEKGYAVCVVLASPGYPGPYPQGLPITGIEAAEKLDDIVVFHAGTVVKDGQLVTAGGRVLNVTAVGPSIDKALEKAYTAIKRIDFAGMHYRTDIGHRPN